MSLGCRRVPNFNRERLNQNSCETIVTTPKDGYVYLPREYSTQLINEFPQNQYYEKFNRKELVPPHKSVNIPYNPRNICASPNSYAEED